MMAGTEGGMTAIERIDKHVNLEQPDRVGIAPFGEFYYQWSEAILAQMSRDPEWPHGRSHSGQSES